VIYLASTDLAQSQFEKASLLAGTAFTEKLLYYANAWLPARDILLAAVAASKLNFDATGRIILLEQFIPWKVNGVIVGLPCTKFRRNIYLNSRLILSWRLNLMKQSTWYTQMRRLEIGVYKPFLYLLTVSRVARLFRSSGRD
jgi:hypothetical protein